MQWPWVSRERFMDAERRCAAVDAERRRLLDLLLSPPVPAEEMRAKTVVQRVAEVESERATVAVVESAEPIAFSTPFDRVLNRFDAVRQGKGRIPEQYRARMN